MTKYTLITGASGGFGTQFAKLAAREGRNMILTARSRDALDAVAQQVREDDIDVVVIAADLSELAGAERLWAEATDGRVIDVLVNNAGLGYCGQFSEPDAWPRELASIDVNMRAFTYLMKQAIAHMQSHGQGRVLNVASTGGFMPGPGMAVYCATKAYAVSLSEAVAEELRGTNVSVTAFCPGVTDTNFLDDAAMLDIPLVKYGKPGPAFPVAEEGWLEARIAKRVVIPGLLNKFLAIAPRFVPRPITTRIASVVFRRP